MIRCYYWPRELRLVMAGHAPVHSEKNKQQCAAASALLYSLISAVNGFRRKGWARIHGTYTLAESGIAAVRINARLWHFKACRVAIGMCFGGLMMLADKYPEAVSAEVVTGVDFNDKLARSPSKDGGVSYLQKWLYDIRKGSLTNEQKGGNHEE